MTQTTYFPDLYTVSKTGKRQIWSIKVMNEGSQSRTVTTRGFLDGKLTVNEKITKKGKNIGKNNETTHYTQAISEAQSKWNSKKDRLYTENPDKDERRGCTNPDTKTLNKAKIPKLPNVLLPMLALDYNKRSGDINFPCFVQPKIDGVRAIFRGGNFYSRTGKLFPPISHISSTLSGTNVVLDGELYSDELSFQEIIGAIKKSKPESKKLVYIVYDVIDTNLDYRDRLEILKKVVQISPAVSLIKTEICKSSLEIDSFHDKYVLQGYEGLIIRNSLGKYELKHRSKNLQKFKKFEDGEFRIVGATSGTGKEEGLVIWIVETGDGGRFQVRPLGTYSDRKILYRNRNKYIGKMLTVRYFGLSDTGIPRFPVGIQIRDYE